MLGNRRHHCIRIFEYCAVLDAQDANAEPFEIGGASFVSVIRCIVVMRGAVQFDGEFLSSAIEVDAVLAAEFPTLKAAALEVRPKTRFRRRERSPKRTTALSENVKVVDAHLDHPAACGGTPPWKGGECTAGPAYFA